MTIFALGAIFAVSSILWIGSGIENENSQIAAAVLGLVGLGIGGMSLIAIIVVTLYPKLTKERTWPQKDR